MNFTNRQSRLIAVRIHLFLKTWLLKYYILKVKPSRGLYMSFFNYWIYFFFIRDGDDNVTGSAGARRVPVGRALAPTWRCITPAFLAVAAHFTSGARVTLSACVRSEVMCELLILHWSHRATSSSRVSVFSHIHTFLEQTCIIPIKIMQLLYNPASSHQY